MNEHEILQSFWHNSDGTWTPWSAPGQTPPSQDFCGTAALPLKPDIARRGWHGRTVPQADSCTAAKSNPLTSRSAQRPERRLGDSEHDVQRNRRRRDELVGWFRSDAGHIDQPSGD